MMFQATMEQARLLADVFIGRQSDYAVQTDEGRYRRVGHPLSLEIVQDHLNDVRTIGTYVMDEEGQCFFAVFDADQSDGLSVLAELRRTLAGQDIPSYLEESRRGGHLWVLFDTPAPAWAVRQWLLPFCPEGVEFYPKQDETNGYGSLIRVPLGMHRKSGCWYPFVVRRGGQLMYVSQDKADMLSALTQVRRAVVPLDLFQAYRRESRLRTQPHTSVAIPSPTHYLGQNATIADWCASYDPIAYLSQYVSLDRQGLGHCPFVEHHRNGKDRHPSFQVFSPRRPGGVCWRCYAGDISGDLFNFLQRWHGLEAGELWAHLRGQKQH